MLDLALYIAVIVFVYALTRVVRFKSLRVTTTDKLIAFCQENSLAIPEDATLRRHFLTQLQSDLDCAG